MKKILALVAVAALVAFAAPAFAANPFMDVPMNHWAYDAISQLASQGVVSGYPDGTFKGNNPMTRYEMASIVARGLAVVDMDKASKQDVEMLKKLVVEFKDELDALGVKVDELDSRVAVLEENLGGWKFWGEVRMDTKWADKESADSSAYNGNYPLVGDTEFDLNRYRLWIKKTVNDDLYFVGRLTGEDVSFSRWYAGMTAPYGFEVLIGQFNFDWECDHGLVGPYQDDDFFCDRTVKGFYASKEFGMGDMAFVVSHKDADTKDADGNVTLLGGDDAYLYGGKVNFNFNEQFRFALNGLLVDGTTNVTDMNIFWADWTFEFTPGVAFKGEYFFEDNDVVFGSGTEDSPSAYRAILEVGQDVFGFTSLWAEYSNMDEGFKMLNSFAYDAFNSAQLLQNRGDYEETDILYIVAEQQWNDKWGTFLRYANADITGVADDTTDWTAGVVFRYMPGVTFTLSYDDVDYGTNGEGYENGDNNMISLRTHIKF